VGRRKDQSSIFAPIGATPSPSPGSLNPPVQEVDPGAGESEPINLPSTPPVQEAPEPIHLPGDPISEPIDDPLAPIVNPSPEPTPIVEPTPEPIATPSPSPGSFNLDPTFPGYPSEIPKFESLQEMIDFYRSFLIFGTREEMISYFMPSGQPAAFDTPVDELRGSDPAALVGLIGHSRGRGGEQIFIVNERGSKAITDVAPFRSLPVGSGQTFAQWVAENPLNWTGRRDFGLVAPLPREVLE